MAGNMQAVNIIAVLGALDGEVDDLDRVLAIEAIAQQHQKKTGEGAAE